MDLSTSFQSTHVSTSTFRYDTVEMENWLKHCLRSLLFQPVNKAMSAALVCVSGSMLEIEPATEVNKKWTVIWMHENNNQSKRRLLIRLSKLI